MFSDKLIEADLELSTNGDGRSSTDPPRRNAEFAARGFRKEGVS